MERLKILISGLALPTQITGSWLHRIYKFQSNLNYFDFVLSPTKVPSSVFIHCEKKKSGRWQKLWYRKNLPSYLSSDYIDFIRPLIANKKPLQLLVMDDTSLLEAVICIRSMLPQGSEICFSFHGHWLMAKPWVLDKVDKVFFLTWEGYKKTLTFNLQFTPQAFIVGNGVENEFFFPLAPEEKIHRKKVLGFGENDTILIWMANSRPVKGLHLFKKIALKILEKHQGVKVLSIGHPIETDIDHPHWIQVGKLPHKQLPEYLQVGDFYFFTSLWQEGFGLSLVEAIKCGNIALASSVGGIPEVLQGQNRSLLVEDPNFVHSWLETFDRAIVQFEGDNIAEDFELLKNSLSNWHTYMSWEKRYYQALTD